MSDLTTPLIEIDKIDVEEGFNARTHMDEDGLEQLAESIGTDGIVQPIAVRPTKGGRFSVIAGHRRFEAARRAGITEVPITLSEGNAHLNSLIENIHQEKLDPIDTANGLKMVAGELNLTTNKQIAARANKKVAWVSERLRLLDLPEGVQRLIATGDIPMEAERVLRDIAKVSPRVAECVCELAKREKVKGRSFIVNFDDLFRQTAEARFKDKPTMISIWRSRLSVVVSDAKKRGELSERIQVLRPYQGSDPVVQFFDAEVDAARAAGCLVEHRVERRGVISATAFITDAVFAADLAERSVERMEAEAAKEAEEDAAYAARQAEMNSAGKSEQEARKTKREEVKAKKEKAEVFNEDLSGKLFKGRTEARRKQQSLTRAKAVGLTLVADNPQLAGRGLRLVLPQLQDVEVKELKSGEMRTKVSYADAEQCTEELARRIEKATSANEVLEVLSEALVAAMLADEHQLPQTKRIYWHSPSTAAEKLLGSDVKAVRPRRRSAR
jgi:ParB family chromosome partitioning protein